MAERNFLTINEVSKAYVSRALLDGATAGVAEGDKIGVIGINGTGKSTLLSIAAGIVEPDSGEVIRGNDIRISYLPQNPIFDNEKTLLENVVEAVSGKAGHWDTVGEVRATLAKFGLTDPDMNPDDLSGGQKKRAALVAAILTPSELLILDEPTNHLDSEMSGWLEEFLKGYQGAILMITHDRYFLDAVTNQIWEIDHGKIYKYKENYSGFLKLKAERMDYARAAERKAATLYRQDLAWMQRGARARSTKQKAHIQRFEQLRDRDKIVEDRQVELNSLASRLGGKTIEADNITKGYDGRVLFHDFTYHFLKTDRIGIIGPNGCGKSTLIKCLIGEEQPDSGSVAIGQTVKIGYFSQENEALDEGSRVIDYIRDTAEYIRTADGLTSASAMCEKFLFDPEMQYAPIAKLSGGEKRRLYLLKVLMEAPNVLILDEPTNDLDIATLRILEDYLDKFAGIVITVSHDRYFLDRVVTRIFSYEPDGTIRQSEGGYEEYLEHREAWGTGVAQTIVKRVDGTEEAGRNTKDNWKQQSGDAPKKKKLSFKEQREYDLLPGEIETLEQRAEELAVEIEGAVTEYSRLQKLTEEKEAVDAELEVKMERYFELQELVEELAQEN